MPKIPPIGKGPINTLITWDVYRLNRQWVYGEYVFTLQMLRVPPNAPEYRLRQGRNWTNTTRPIHGIFAEAAVRLWKNNHRHTLNLDKGATPCPTCPHENPSSPPNS